MTDIFVGINKVQKYERPILFGSSSDSDAFND